MSSSGAGSFNRRRVSTLVGEAHSHRNFFHANSEPNMAMCVSKAPSGAEQIGNEDYLRSTEKKLPKLRRKSTSEKFLKSTPLKDSMLDPSYPSIPEYPSLATKRTTPFGESVAKPGDSNGFTSAERSMIAPHARAMGSMGGTPRSFHRATSTDMGGFLTKAESTDSDSDSGSGSDEELAPSPAPEEMEQKKTGRRGSFAHMVEIDLPAWNETHGEVYDPHSNKSFNLSNEFLSNRILSTRDKQTMKQHFWFGDPHLILFFSRFSTLLAAGQLVCILSQAGPYLFHMQQSGVEPEDDEEAGFEGEEDEFVYGSPGNELAMLPLAVRLFILLLLVIGPTLVYLRIPVLIRDLVIVWHVGHRADPLVVAEVVRRQKTQIALRSLRLVTLMKMFAEKHIDETPRTSHQSRKDLAAAVEDAQGAPPVSKLSPRDKEDLRAMFHAFDAEHRGTVSNQNMTAFLMAIFDGNRDVAMKMCAMIDADDDGHVEEEEFLDWASMIELNHQEDEDEIHVHMFKMIDTDGSGDITISELSEFMMKFGCEMEDQVHFRGGFGAHFTGGSSREGLVQITTMRPSTYPYNAPTRARVQTRIYFFSKITLACCTDPH